MCVDLWYNKPWLWPNKWWIIRHLLPYHKLFHKCWVFHDYAYSKLEDKDKADWLFYQMMRAVSKSKLQLHFAEIYYNLVKEYWYIFYKNNINETSKNFKKIT